jgi:L-ascorbate metabolism protein UlaG (beta-lactamase superfamily)
VGVLCAVLLLAGVFLMMSWTGLGAAMTGEQLARVKNSPNFKDGRFQNPIPTDNSLGFEKWWPTVREYLKGQERVPGVAPPVHHLSQESFETPPNPGLRITWLGHSSVLIEMDDKVILLDPVFGERASPYTFMGPKRFHPAPVSISDLPELDAVLISHDHYDHLDYDTIIQLVPKTTTFYVPLGVGAHFEYWKIPAPKCVEMDWWEERELEGRFRLIACPARHFSGRMGFGDRTLWVSWALIGPSHRVFFSGDTGIMPLFQEVGERFGPFDATLMKVGAYGITWPDIHITPEEAIEVHRMVRGRLLMPVHWGTFNLSYHSWTEPVERLLSASAEMGVEVAIPKPGQSVEPERPPAVERWWRNAL